MECLGNLLGGFFVVVKINLNLSNVIGNREWGYKGVILDSAFVFPIVFGGASGAEM